MGWLRDLMLRSEPPVSSLGDLARKALAHPDWPKASAIRERSLATLLSKLDRGQELDWLRDRPEELGVLAKALGRPASEVGQLLGDTPVRRDRRVFRFHDLRYARDLDLVREDLPPGFPRELKHPVHWGRPLVWLAPSGAGRSLLGAWLEARGLAQFCHLSESEDDIPANGALFVDLEAGRALTPDDLARLGRRERPFCIAVSRRSQVADVLPEADVVEAAQPSEYLSDLAQWVGGRVGPEGHFDAERAATWMRRTILPSAPLAAWGETLGLLGLFDEIPSRELVRADLAQTLRLFVQRRIKETRNLPLSPPDEVFGRLVTVTAKLLTEGGTGMNGPRSLEGWLDAFGDDASTARRSSEGDEGLSPHQLFRTLLSANLLRREWLPLDAPDLERYSLGPHCLVALLHSLALDDVFRAPAREWGHALLNTRGHERELDLMKRLVRHATEGNLKAHYAVVEGIDPGGPKDDAFVCALEASVESLGIAALRGSSPPVELCQELLLEYSRYLVKVGDQLETRLREPEPVLAGYLALCLETVGVRPELDPIQNDQSRLLLALTERLFSWALRPLADARAPSELSLAITLTLLARAWRARGGVSADLPELEHSTLTLLVTPERLVPREGLAILVIEHISVDVLEHALTLEGTDSAAFYRAIWQELLLVEPKVLARSQNLRLHLSSKSPAFHRALPGAALSRVDLESVIRFDLLLPHQLEARIRSGPCPLPKAAILSGPIDVAVERLEREGPEHLGYEAVRGMYERSPKLTTRALLKRFFEGGDARSLHAISAHHQLHTILPELPTTPELLHFEGGQVDAVRLALLEVTRTSLDPATRSSAYERLDLLEAAISRA